MKSRKSLPRILLVNPWIHDFSAYDFRQKPLGLLYIGAILETLGYPVSLLDCMDRYQPAWLEPGAPCDGRADHEGAGKYPREEIVKPAALAEIPRKYCRYGAPRERIEAWLGSQPPPDIILMTSFMTYWYPGVVEMAELLRKHVPHATLVLGGVYATLCPEHARQAVRPDYLLAGEGEQAAIRLIAGLCDGPGGDFAFDQLDELPYPWYQGYPVLASIALVTSRGCPYSCSYCASRLLAAGYRRRTAAAVFQEILHWQEHRGIRQIAFFDDALLHQPELYAKPLLRLITAADKDLSLHTPNGVQPRCIDAELADLLVAAGIKSLRLSYESSSHLQQQGKVTTSELESALHHLTRAGLRPAETGVYILAGMPGQPMSEVRASARRVHELGARIHLASFSPIPGTRAYLQGLERGEWETGEDLLWTNNSLFPLWRQRHSREELAELLLWIKQLNHSLPSSEDSLCRNLQNGPA